MCSYATRLRSGQSLLVEPPRCLVDPRLRAQLFLIAHDDDSGRLHIDERALTVGLASAILLELWLAGKIYTGWRYDVRRGDWDHDPARITVMDPTPTGDPLADIALATLWYDGGTILVKDFVKRFAANGLYERVRADMIASGLLHRVRRRRFLLFSGEVHKPVKRSLPVRVRARLRDLADRYQRGGGRKQRDEPIIALAALVTALGLTSHLYPSDMTAARLHLCLNDIISAQQDPAIRDGVTGINASRGYLAVRTLRDAAAS